MLSYVLCLWYLTPLGLGPALAAPGAKPQQARPKAAPKAAPGARRAAPADRRAPAARTKGQPPVRRAIRLGPMLFHVQGGKVKTIEQLQLPELFRIASQMYQKKKYATSIRLYRRILRFFPKHKHRYAALYNLALALEDAGQLKEAIGRYQEMIQQHPKRKANVLNARFRMAACFNRLKKWSAAFQIYGGLLQTSLSLEDRVDALAYAGRALFHMGKYAEALPLLRLAVLTHTRKPKRSISYAAAMAQYYRGYTHDKLFRKRKFHLPQMRLKQDLDYKSEQMLEAQKLYFQTIRLRHADWALAALYRIGDMYEQMYRDMMASPVPKDFTKKEIRIYRSLLRNKIKVLLAKALMAYRMNLRLAGVIGLKSHTWEARSKKRFAELRTFYRKWFGKDPDVLQPGQKPTSRPTSRPVTSKPTQPTKAQPAPSRAAPKAPAKQPAPAKRPTSPAKRPAAPAKRPAAPAKRPAAPARRAPAKRADAPKAPARRAPAKRDAPKSRAAAQPPARSR